jgi:RNA polymerase-interacting CarD/CdnL/TRCF family regulator
MSIKRRFAWMPALCLFAAPLHADLQRAMAEPNLEKRSQLALDNATASYKHARAAYEKGELDDVAAAAKEFQESIDLAFTSLTKTGKDPRRSPKWFKKAEIETRDLLRRLESFQQEMSFSDRPLLDPAKNRLTQVHDELLVGLMEGKRK